MDLANVGADGVSATVEFARENHGEAGSSKQCNDQRTDQTAFLNGAYHHRFHSKHKKGTL